jgi:hypothetical protein
MISRWPKIILVAALLSIVHPAISQQSSPASPQSTPPAAATTSAANGTPLLVELFTSEGCSSCPPADDILAAIEKQQPFASTQIIAIEEHVDYFNHDGWIDPFSSPEWTQRQMVYDEALHSGTPATPQMIIEGQSQLVGNRLNPVVEAIRTAAAKPRTEVAVTLKSSAATDEPSFNISVGKLVDAQEKDTPEIWLVITESGLHSDVSRGENAGHDLHHASVLRVLRKVGTIKQAAGDAASFNGDASIKIKSSWKRENLLAVAIVQEKKSRRILGASAIPIAK